VSEVQFRQRLAWFAPFLESFFANADVQRAGVILSGSLIPLCLLTHQVDTEDEARFMAYAKESYRNCSIDLYVTNTAMSPRDIESCLVTAALGTSVTRRLQWCEDDEWAVRARHGYTLYIDTYNIHIIVMADTSRQDAIVHQHLPCVRAYWDGKRLVATSSCCVSWMTRFVFEPPLFGNRIDVQRRSKIMVKYAMRGFGFSTQSIAGLQVPTTIRQWLMEDRRHDCPLPWYHPLYNPDLWKKAMTQERERALIECAEL
jgi:hypothetical protein